MVMFESRSTSLLKPKAQNDQGERAVNKVTATSELISARKANALLSKNMFDRQRPIKPWRVKELSELAKLGKFYQNSTISMAHLDNEIYLVDGQHRLASIVETGSPQRFTVVRHFVDDYSDVEELYLTFDRGNKRTPQDALRSIGFEDTELGDLPKFMRNVAYSSSAFATGGCYIRLSGPSDGDRPVMRIRRLFKDIETRMQIMHLWQEELVIATELFNKAGSFQRRLYMREAIVSVMLITLKYCRVEAQEFWSDILLNNMSAKHPGQILLSFIIKRREQINNHLYLARYTANLWNFFKAKLEKGKTSIYDISAPIILLDTPHDGKDHQIYIDLIGNLYTHPFGLNSLESDK